MHANFTCPCCGQPLTVEGTYLRCAAHGLFFRYGPRRLLAAPQPEVRDDYLMPWQTLADTAPERLELPAATTAAATK